MELRSEGYKRRLAEIEKDKILSRDITLDVRLRGEVNTYLDDQRRQTIQLIGKELAVEYLNSLEEA